MSDAHVRLNDVLEGRYHIEHELGEGGMATVYLADDLKHERKVALKVLKPELAAVVGADRFLAEIKTTANLQHPHILPLFDSGEADGFLFYVMPYVEGESLRDRLDREKQLPVAEAVRIATDLAEALDYAHRNGVIHRDIQPANILMHEGRPLLADFGIALAVSAAGGGRLTETGLSLGTPYYMSPEQAAGDREVDRRSDEYALGCVLYEMLVGDPPHTGSNAQTVLAKILTDSPSGPQKTRASVPANVDAAIRRALEKLPADRFSSAQEFAGALRNPKFTHGESVAADGVAGGGPGSRLTMALAGTAAFFALAFAWTLVRPEPAEAPNLLIPGGEGWEGLTAPVGRRTAIAPDGSSMVLPLDGPLALKLRGSAELVPLSGTENAWDVVYSPDAQWIAYTMDDELFKRPTIGGAPIRLAEGVDDASLVSVSALDWLDDGTLLYERARAADRDLMRIPEDGGEAELVIGGDDPVVPVWVRGLPGSQVALLVACPGRGTQSCVPARSNVYSVDLVARSHQLLLERVVRAWYAPTGHVVYVRSDGAVFAQPFDPGTGEFTGGAHPIVGHVRLTNGWADMRLASAGTLMYVEGARGAGDASDLNLRSLVSMNAAGEREELPLAPRPYLFFAPSWSPDGQSVVFASAGHIYTYDVIRNSTPRQLTFFEGASFRPVFSPDGSRVVFGSNFEGTDGFDLFVKGMPLWSSDGGAVYYLAGDRDVGGISGVVMRARVETEPVPVVVSRDTLFTIPERGMVGPAFTPWTRRCSSQFGKNGVARGTADSGV